MPKQHEPKFTVDRSEEAILIDAGDITLLFDFTLGTLEIATSNSLEDDGWIESVVVKEDCIPRLIKALLQVKPNRRRLKRLLQRKLPPDTLTHDHEQTD